MTPPQDDDRADPLADLLAGAGDDTPPPDRLFLDRLRDESTTVFMTAGMATPAEPARPSPSPRRRSPMLTALVRIAAAALAAAVLVGVGVRFWPHEPEEAPLVAALDRLADADGLHLQVTKAGQTGEVWVARANKLRWEESADKYLIARGQRVFRVDESANRVTAGIGDYFRPDRPGVDVFALLGLPRPAPDTIREAQPVGRADRDGTAVDVFRLELADRDGTPLTVEAEAEAKTGALHAVRAFAVRNGAPQVVASLLVMAQGKPVPDEKFAVKDMLSEDGRVGKVADVQGVVAVRPVGRQRWTPVRPNLLLMPGDWVRADVRGANAAALKLLPQAHLVVGPGGLVEVRKPTQVRLHEGEAEFTPAKNTPIELLGPKDAKVTLTARAHYRVQGDALVKVEEPSAWLSGFKGVTAGESLGSLVAKVDGRNVPLSVGYHKVAVEVRDQIARTTIDESFVNHTNGQLEGQFHFPLPQDASIAGFAMDVNGEMVEADVVEKQRAREIYEEIMREKRDPGLLEWTGGNVFKARVWPILPNSEKRVRITYTQVLPLTGKSYRYSYALQSEMLQQHPLKELAIHFSVSSAAPIKSVTCPTHTVRAEQTEHAARLEFAAQEHTPTKDFEAVVELADDAPPVTVVPHRRGSDGYFMVQVTPPAPADAGRQVLADAGPLNVVLLCDTSGSIDPTQRANQLAVATAVMEALTPNDTFNLAACDVSPEWAFEKPQPATPDNVRAARNRLVGRPSLGWTDLDRAFESALKQVGPKGHVVYLGDGIVTTGDASPQAFADRLKAIYQASGSQAACHAVALGSAFEPGVLKAIGSLGGGSVRRVTGEQGPVAVALELLGEITRPPVRDVKVEFHGWKTATVYPEALPNLVPGTQQILIGRYLPEGQDQSSEVVVTGVRDGQPVRYTARATLKDADAGNSFLPRLWARMHLDKLLERPQTEPVKDEVIGLSEEFHIMTPYTSFLVLESDADRERFKVKRRFQMRDGEQYFQQGRDQAAYDLARQQMKKAGDWRVGLRRTVLARLSGLGRNPQFANAGGLPGIAGRSAGTYDRFTRGGGGFGGGEHFFLYGLGEAEGQSRSGALRDEWAFGANGPVTMLGRGLGDYTQYGVTLSAEDVSGVSGWSTPALGLPGMMTRQFAGEEFGFDFAEKDKKLSELDGLHDRLSLTADGTLAPGYFDLDFDYGTTLAKAITDSRGRRGEARQLYAGLAFEPAGGIAGKPGQAYFKLAARRKQEAYAPQRWFDSVVPHLPAPPTNDPKPTDWPADARALAKLLDRKPDLAKLAGGLRVERTTESEPAGTARRIDLYSPTAWARRTASDTERTVVEWCDGRERAVFVPVYGTGRTRPAAPADLRTPGLVVEEATLGPLDEANPGLTAAVEAGVLVLRRSGNQLEIRYTIDPEKRVTTRIETRQHGKPIQVVTFADFTEAGGLWWATRIETTDGAGHVVSRTSQSVTAVPAADFARQTNELTAGRESVLFLKAPGPKLADAGTATVDDQFTLLASYAAYQNWAKAGEHLAALEKLAAGKPGAKWLRTVFLQASRRGEELRQRLVAEADALAKAPAGGDRLAVAEFVYQQGAAALAWNETVDLLDRLRPVYADLPKTSSHRRSWLQNRVNALSNAGRPDESLAFLKQLTDEFPRDYTFQSQYAQALNQRGDTEGAVAYLKRLLAQDHWAAWEADQFRSLAAEWLESRGRLSDVIPFLEDWLKRDPTSADPYSRYLSALVRTGDQAKADELIGKWLSEAKQDGDIPAPVRARFEAAATTAAGRGRNIGTDRIDPKWLKPLADAARFFLRHPTHYALADDILHTNAFQSTDEGRQVRTDLFAVLLDGAADLPEPKLHHLLVRVQHVPPEVDRAAWVKLTDALQARWAQTEGADARHQLGQHIGQILSRCLGADESLAFLRREVKDGPAEYRPTYDAWLFDTLIGRPWTAELEAEALSLLPRLGDDSDADRKLAAQVAALHRLTDRVVQARADAANKAIPNPEKLTRTELARKQAENLTAARTGFADRLAKAELPAELRPWAKAERLYLLTQAGADPKAIAAECWAVLGDAPKPRKADDEDGPSVREALDDYLRERYLTTALYCATRPGSDPAAVARVLRYLDAGAAAEPAEPGWKTAKFDLLVALDRPKELEPVLAAWAKAGDPDGRWRTALGYLLAELGRLKEAIKNFEEVEKADALGYAGYRALAGWYMAVNDKSAHEKALADSYRRLDDGTLYQLLRVKIAPWQQGGRAMPTEFDPDVLRVFAVLFQKSDQPQVYLNQLRQVYGVTRDFRLLGTAADAVLGQSAGKVYPFLEGMVNVLNDVRDEATADELLARVETLRQQGKTPTDLRALDLLEMQVRRRAAELINQPGPHAEKALTAMKRAYDRPWADGEKLMMSNLLRNLGRIARPELADEQLRELKELHAGAKPGTFERLRLAHNLGGTLNGYDRRPEAVATLRAGLDEYAAAHDGTLPPDANGTISTLLSVHYAMGHHDRAEDYLAQQLKKPADAGQTRWLGLRLDETYHNALSADTAVSLGKGAELYRNLERRLAKEADTPDPSHRAEVVSRLCWVYRTARDKKLPTAAADLTTFAGTTLPPLLRDQPVQAEQVVSTVAQAVRDVAGPAEAVGFLVARIEAEPVWLRHGNQDGWARHGWAVAQWRSEARVLPADVDAKLLKIVLAELKDDLRTGRQRNRAIYHAGHSYYWPEKEADFAAAAEEVYRERRNSGPGVQYVAEYLYHGGNRRDRATEMMADAHARKILDDGGQQQLVHYLHGLSRYAESVPVLTPLIERNPDNLHYRTLLFTAYYQLKETEPLKAAFAAAEKHFRDKSRWAEGAMATLAESAVNCRLDERAIKILGELIPLHQQTHPNRGVGNGQLSRYYQLQARAFAALGRTSEAIDAAGGAIVSWGANTNGRTDALNTLRNVLAAAANLDEVVARLDDQTAKTGLVNPTVRKAVGKVYLDRGKNREAAVQLQVALSGQPNDAEALQMLVDSYDRAKDPDGATAAVLRAVEFNRRDVKRYDDLGKRYEAAGRPVEAERAYTSIVEALPNEAEGHQLLAEVRQRQGRWADAIAHWEQVARFRALEPTGLIGLAAAQLHEKQYDKAAETVKRLQARTWPARFADAPQRIADLERQLQGKAK